MKKILVVRHEQSETVDKKLVGVMLSQQVSYYLALHALAKGVTKSSILRYILYRWYHKEKDKSSQLIKEITDIIQHEWGIHKLLIYNKSVEEAFSDFNAQINDDLQKRGISRNHIKKILKNICI